MTEVPHTFLTLKPKLSLELEHAALYLPLEAITGLLIGQLV